MSLQRVSDLCSILLTNGGILIDVDQGVKRDVLGGYSSRKLGGKETEQLKRSILEITWPRENIENPTQFDSKSVEYEALCAYVTHNILNEDYAFVGDKTLDGNLSVMGDVYGQGESLKLYYDDVNISANNIDINAVNKVTISANVTNVIGVDYLNLSVINQDKSDSHIDIINKQRIILSTDNLITYGKKTEMIYDDSFVIKWRKPDGTLVPVITLGHTSDNSSPTVTINSTETNPVSCYSKYALWG